MSELAAAELLAELAGIDDEEERDLAADEWLDSRSVSEAARELLAAADESLPSQRLIALDLVDLLGEEAVPQWRAMTGAPRIGPHARMAIAYWMDSDAEEADVRWVAADQAAAALADLGTDEALTLIYESLPGPDLDPAACLSAVAGSGHPDAEALARSLGEFIDSGAPRTMDQVVQLKVGLTGSEPPSWRRVQLPAATTLAELHDVIQVLYGWDGDHPHAFTVGDREYSDPELGLEGTSDEDGLRVLAAFKRAGKKIDYLYDFEAGWRHEITLEQVIERDWATAYPVCTEFSADSPVEDQDEDDPSGPEPFRIADINRRLATMY